MFFEEKDLMGDIEGLSVYEVEVLIDWEFKFMSKYVKVGIVKLSVVRSEEILIEFIDEMFVFVEQEMISDVVKYLELVKLGGKKVVLLFCICNCIVLKGVFVVLLKNIYVQMMFVFIQVQLNYFQVVGYQMDWLKIIIQVKVLFLISFFFQWC